MTTAINTVHVPCATCDSCVPAPGLSAIGECIDCDFERAQANATGGIPSATKARIAEQKAAWELQDAADAAAFEALANRNDAAARNQIANARKAERVRAATQPPTPAELDARWAAYWA